MDQGSNNWLEWRNKGIGSSDAPVIVGASPYKTRHQLWLEKTGQVKPKDSNWAMQRGTDMEAKARAHYELVHGSAMPPSVVEHKEYPFLRASLDGYDGETILEIKCPGKQDHALAVKGLVPDKYYPQLQHQLMVTGAKTAHYWSFDGENGALVFVRPDKEYIQKLAEEEIVFWHHVATLRPVPLSDLDYKNVESESLQFAIRAWREIKRQVDLLKDQEEKRREEITEMIKNDHPRLQFENVQILKSTRQGNVDYSKIPNLEGVNIENYRKPSTEFYTFRVEK